MAATTSTQIIDGLLAADLGKRHFSKWESKAQQEAIRRCGISTSSSPYFKNNKDGRTAMLTHLHNTPLPVDHLTVLRRIAELGLPPSGARSKQQFSYYLLSAMCEPLKFPPWEPIPLITIVPPNTDELVTSARSLCEERMSKPAIKSNFYRPQEERESPPATQERDRLWSERRSRWYPFMKSSAFQSFLTSLALQYVQVTNIVLAHSPKSKPNDLRCEIDDALVKVDRVRVPGMFVDAWKSAGNGVIEKFEWREWRFGLGHILASTKRAVAKAVRTQHSDEDPEDERVYVGDTVCGVPLCTHA